MELDAIHASGNTGSQTEKSTLLTSLKKSAE